MISMSENNNSGKKKGNVLFNGRTAVHKESGGVLVTVDVCLTKIGKSVVPIPYTNIARSEDAARTSSTVFVNGNPICHKNSIFYKSTGDEPGTKGGIKSGTITGKAEFITASSNIFIEGVPVVRNGDLMVSNNRNTAPMPLVQPNGPLPKSLDISDTEGLEESEQPDRIDIGHSGESNPLLKGNHRSSK